MRKRLYAGLVGLPVLVVIVIGVLAGPGSADPNLPTVPVHRHWLGDPSLGGAHQIGPDICKNTNVQNAFNQFHFNHHHSFIPGVGQIVSNGPQNGNPGLNNDKGGEIFATGGCGPVPPGNN
jgi:hypothetical protein